MLNSRVVVFEAVCRGSLDWRVCIDGEDEAIAFANRESCVAAATARARRRHLDTGRVTEVWAPRIGGSRECIVRFMTPNEFDALLGRRLPAPDADEAAPVRAASLHLL